MEILTASLWTALSLYVMYKTSAVYSYLSLPIFSWLDRVTKVKSYKAQHEKLGTSYSDFMSTYHNNFLVKLLSCRYCFGLWLSFGVCYCLSMIQSLPAVYFGGQALCTIFDCFERKINDV